jgi:hypothetical protein
MAEVLEAEAKTAEADARTETAVSEGEARVELAVSEAELRTEQAVRLSSNCVSMHHELS